jgi:hypothetical protein
MPMMIESSIESYIDHISSRKKPHISKIASLLVQLNMSMAFSPPPMRKEGREGREMTVWSTERQIHEIQKNERDVKAAQERDGKHPLEETTSPSSPTRDANGCKKKDKKKMTQRLQLNDQSKPFTTF